MESFLILSTNEEESLCRETAPSGKLLRAMSPCSMTPGTFKATLSTASQAATLSLLHNILQVWVYSYSHTPGIWKKVGSESWKHLKTVFRLQIVLLKCTGNFSRIPKQILAFGINYVCCKKIRDQLIQLLLTSSILLQFNYPERRQIC